MAELMKSGQTDFEMVFDPKAKKWEFVIAYNNNGEVLGPVEFK